MHKLHMYENGLTLQPELSMAQAFKL